MDSYNDTAKHMFNFRNIDNTLLSSLTFLHQCCLCLNLTKTVTPFLIKLNLDIYLMERITLNPSFPKLREGRTTNSLILFKLKMEVFILIKILLMQQ